MNRDGFKFAYLSLVSWTANLALWRLALFLWITFFLAPLSRAAKAADRALVASDLLPAAKCFLKFLAVFRIASRASRLTWRRRMFCRAALMADLVLGIGDVL